MKLPDLCKALCAAASVWRCRRAATAVEYGLIIALIVLGMLVGLKAVASANGDKWNDIRAKVAEVTPA